MPKYVDIETVTPYAELIDRYLVDHYGCTSAWFEIDAPCADVAAADRLVAIQRAFIQLIEKLPDFIVQIQFLYTTNGDYREMLHQHAAFQSQSAVANYLRQVRVKRLLEDVKTRRLVRASTIMVITCGPRRAAERQNAVSDQMRIMGLPDKQLPRRLIRRDEFDQAVNSLQTAEAVIAEAIGPVNVATRVMGPEQIAGYFYRLFNPDLAIDQGLPLNFKPDDTAFPDAWLCSEVQLYDDCLKWGDYYHAFVSMNQKPLQSSPRLAERITTQLPFSDVRIAYNIRRLDTRREAEALRWRRLHAIAMTRFNPFAPHQKGQGDDEIYDVDADERKKEADTVLRALRSGTMYLAQVQMVAHFWHRDRQELNRRREQILTHIGDMNRARGWREAHSTLPVFRCSLPGAYEPLCRDVKVPDAMAADLIPLHKGYEGASQPVCLFRNGVGGLVAFDLFERTVAETSLAFVSGGSGSGKSFLANYLILNHLVGRTRLIILDVGGSYDSLIKLLGGQIVKFSQSAPICFNPLQVYSGGEHIIKPDETHMARMMANLEAILAQPNDPNGELTVSMRNILKGCLEQVFGNRATKAFLCLSDLRSVLENRRNKADNAQDADQTRELHERLMQFITGGLYAKWFDGPTVFDLKTNIICFDLKGIRENKALTRAIIPVLINYITQIIMADREERKLVVFDEMWEHLENPVIRDFIVSTWRTIRKENGAAIGISQSFDDLSKHIGNKDVLTALRSNTQHWFILEQNRPEARQRAAEIVELTEGEMDILSNLRARSRLDYTGYLENYRELLIRQGVGEKVLSGRVRLQPTPEEYWLATTRPEEITLRDKTIVQYAGDIGKALSHLAQEHPGGLFVNRSER